MRLHMLVVFVAFGFFWACTDKSQKADTPTAAPAEMAVAQKRMVTVSTAGDKFDPAVEKSQVPDGVWICDMGTVHYARAEKGDGECPLCHMALKLHGAAAEPSEGAASADDEKPEAAEEG